MPVLRCLWYWTHAHARTRARKRLLGFSRTIGVDFVRYVSIRLTNTRKIPNHLTCGHGGKFTTAWAHCSPLTANHIIFSFCFTFQTRLLPINGKREPCQQRDATKPFCRAKLCIISTVDSSDNWFRVRYKAENNNARTWAWGVVKSISLPTKRWLGQSERIDWIRACTPRCHTIKTPKKRRQMSKYWCRRLAPFTCHLCPWL